MTLHRSIFSILVALIILVLIDSCSDQRMSQPDPTTQTNESAAAGAGALVVGTFNEAVGKPIDRSTALRWMDNFIKANPKATKEYAQQLFTEQSV